MKKIILSIPFLLFAFTLKAQIYQKNYQYGFEYQRLKADSALTLPRWAGKLPVNQDSIGLVFYNPADSNLLFHNGKKLIELSTVTDTLGLRALIYARWDSTTIKAIGYLLPKDSVSLSNRINLKLNITDTSAHWAPAGAYIHPVDTSAMLSGYTRKGDTSSVANYWLRRSLFNVANGVAPLDAGGKIPMANLPASLMIYKGTWNPITNTPHLTDSSGVSGWVYIATFSSPPDSVIINVGSGNQTFYSGDYIIYNGSTWQHSVGTNNVKSVNGKQGIVGLTTTDIPEGSNLYFTNPRAQSAISLTTTGTSGAATYSGGVLNVPAYTLAGLGGAPAFTVTTPLTYASNVLGEDTTSAAHGMSSINYVQRQGYLTANQSITVTASGDATGTGSGNTAITLPLTLANSGAIAGGFTRGVVNAKGLITSATDTAYQVAGSYALTNGSNATGTWPISITGTSSSLSAILSSTLGGSGVNNAGTLTWGAGGTLGSNAYTSTAYLPLTGGTLTGTNNIFIIQGNTTSVGVSDIRIVRTGTPNYSAGNAPDIELANNTTGTSAIIQQTSGAIQLYNYTNTHGWKESFRIDTLGNVIDFGLPSAPFVATNSSGTFIPASYTPYNPASYPVNAGGETLQSATTRGNSTSNELQITGSSGTALSGQGLELQFISGSHADILSYDRTANKYMPLDIRAGTTPTNFNQLYIDNTGFLFKDKSGVTQASIDSIGQVHANKFITSGGLSTQHVNGDGSLDGNIYNYAQTLSDYNTSSPLDRLTSGTTYNGGTNVLNAPTAGVAGLQLTLPYDVNYAIQIGSMAGDPTNLYFRDKVSGIWGAWSHFLTSSNYNSYSPTLTGVGASGTWGISITGNAATATNSTQWGSQTDSVVTPLSGQILSYNGRVWVNHTLASADVTGALGFTPYNSTNPSGYISANQTITLSGDITGSGTTAITTTLKNTGTAGTYTKVTTDAQGRVTSGTTLAAADIPSGSGNYIQNTTTQQASANFNIGGNGTVAGNFYLGSTASAAWYSGATVSNINDNGMYYINDTLGLYNQVYLNASQVWTKKTTGDGSLLLMDKQGGLSYYFSPYAALATAANMAKKFSVDSSGNGVVIGTMTATGFYNSSDTTLKHIYFWNPSRDGIESIIYSWKSDPSNRIHWGYAAQQVQKILPNAVVMGTDNKLKVDYNEVHTYKIAALEEDNKQLTEKVDSLQTKLDNVRKEVDDIKKAIQDNSNFHISGKGVSGNGTIGVSLPKTSTGYIQNKTSMTKKEIHK